MKIQVSKAGYSTVSRRAEIMKMIENQRQVDVHQLSRHFKVSEVTIRNDLSQLEQKNMLMRTRGGAIQRQAHVGIDFALSEKLKKNYSEKQRIGRKAASLIQEQDTIILDSGTTTLEIAKNLKRFNDLIVITNSIHIAGQIVGIKNIKVIIPGGFLRENSLSLVGSPAEESFRNYYCDKLFLDVDGISAALGISTPNVEEAHLNRVMIEIARQTIVVTDSSKFSKRSFAGIAPVSKIDILITDSGIPDDERVRIEEAGVQLLIV